MMDETPPNLARHTVKGSALSAAASAVTLGLGVVRVTLMARLLTPEVVGLGALGLLFLDMAMQIGTFGIHSAFIHREEAGDRLRATYFTLNLLTTGVSLLALGLFLPVIVRFYPDYPQLGWVIGAYMGTEVVKVLHTPLTTGLSKNLAFGKIAVLDVSSAVVMTLVGPGMAWLGYGVWSIVGERFSTVLLRVVLMWTVFRPWRVRLGWDWELVRWFWNYGIKAWWITNLAFVLNNFDEFWIGSLPGLRAGALGLYAKAYDYASYSRKVVAAPILAVFFPTFARLQTDRQRLSRAFFRSASLMVRVGSLFSLVFILTAPEFIRLFLGEQWLPMQTTFQLMIVFTLLDPLNFAAQNLLMATGLPEAVLRARLVQTVIFVPSVIVLSILAGIEGVAVAADLMALAGALILYRATYRVATYSSRALWFWPLAAMALTGSVMVGLAPLWAGLATWLAFSLKLILVPALFGGLLLLTERKQLLLGLNTLWGLVRPKMKGT